MKRGMKITLVAATAVALLLMGAKGSVFFQDRARLRDLKQQLALSRATWEEIAARKEELQAELKTAQEDLKEAELTLQESNARAEELRQEISELQEEIAALKK
ncbi:MAG: hypothetical protein IJ153_06295 [Clostridia bacterium]|nr:hypothetical protein [Clostridia bacterium]